MRIHVAAAVIRDAQGQVLIAQRSPVWRLGLVYASFAICPLRSIVLKCASTSPRLSPAGKPASPRNIPQAFALFAWGEGLTYSPRWANS